MQVLNNRIGGRSLGAPSSAVVARRCPTCICSRVVRSKKLSVSAGFSPPSVADTKRKFSEGYGKPIPSIYNTVIQELLVQQHFMRYNLNYDYNMVFALGFVSVFDQILDNYNPEEKEKLFRAYIGSFDENADRYRSDADNLEKLAAGLSGPDQLIPDENGSDLQKALAAIAKRAEEGKLSYNKFFAIGLFRLLELTGAKEPAALEKLVKSVGARPDLVNKDLMLYKSILSKLSAAKELMRDFLEREKRKQSEREAAKAGKGAESEAKAPSGDGATVQA